MNRQEYLNELKIKGFMITEEEAYLKLKRENIILHKKLKKINEISHTT